MLNFSLVDFSICRPKLVAVAIVALYEDTIVVGEQNDAGMLNRETLGRIARVTGTFGFEHPDDLIAGLTQASQ